MTTPFDPGQASASGNPTASAVVLALPAELQRAHAVLAFGTAAILPVDGLAKKLASAADQGRPLRVKLGIDPSGAALTLGHAVVLRKLRQFQDYGHTAVLVVGGFTGQVGDPSGKTSTRAAQSAEAVVANAQGYFDQVMQILDAGRTEVVNNAAWLGSMNLTDLLAYSRQVTVAQLLERDDFAKRFSNKTPISLSEFFYPLLQGIDSVEIQADVELGGTDQTFNNLIGRELQRASGQSPQTVMTLPLLVGTDGKEKMGKSLNNFVAITEPAGEQFGKIMSIPDTAIRAYAELAAAMDAEQVAAVVAAVDAGGIAANGAKRLVARTVVALYHGASAATAAETSFDSVHKHNQLQVEVPEYLLSPEESREGQLHLPRVLVMAGLATSSSAVRRDVDAGAVRVDGQVLTSGTYDLPIAAIAGKVVSIGKRRVIRLVVGG